MTVRVGGHVGGLPLGALLDLIKRTAYREVHLAFNHVNVKANLPPDVATVQIGSPEHGLWWNLKRGMLPEYDVRSAATTVTDGEMEEILYKYGAHPMAQLARQGITQYAHAQRMATDRLLYRKIPSKLVYIGWRSTLRSMLENRAIRGSSEAERLLGAKEYRDVMIRRRLRETVHYDVGF